jgi:hypothetical protein
MIIGQPNKVTDFPAFTEEELTALRATVDTLLGDGAPPNTPIGVDIGVLARLFATIAAQSAKAMPVERPALTLDWLVDRPVGNE